MTKMKRVIMAQGSKGGVGKTTFISALMEWYAANKVPVRALDFDIENAQASGLQHFWPSVEKFDIHRRGALDAILEIIEDKKHDVMVIDQAAASGKPVFEWWREMAGEIGEMGVAFTSVAVVTSDPGSQVSALKWAQEFKKDTDYLIVKNQMNDPDETFGAWEGSDNVVKFRKSLSPREIILESRLSEFEELSRESGIRLSTIADGEAEGLLGELRWRMRAKGYRSRIFEELEGVKDILLPAEEKE